MQDQIIFLSLSFFSISVIYILHLYDKRLINNLYPSPGLVAVVVLFIYYSIPSFLNFLYPDISDLNRAYYGYSLDIYINTALVGLVSYSLLYLGFFYFIKNFKCNSFILINKFDYILSDIKNNKIFYWSIVFIIIGLSAEFYKQYLGFTHYGGVLIVSERGTNFVNRFLSFMYTFFIFGYVNLVYLFLMKKIFGFYKILFIAIVSFSIINAALSGGAAQLIMIITPFFLFNIYSQNYRGGNEIRSKPKLRVKRIFFIAIILIFLSFLLKQSVRNLLNSGIEISFLGIINNHEKIDFNDFFINGYSNLLSSNLIATFPGADSMAIIMHSIDSNENNFQFGNTFLLLFYMFIPRIFWTEKPDIALGMWFTDNYVRSYSDMILAGEGTQGTAFLLPGEFYINFGLIGVVFGMFLVGFLIGYLTKKFFLNQNFGLAKFSYINILYFSVVHHLYSFASYLSTLLSLIILNTLMLLLFIILCKFKSRLKIYK